MSFDLDPVFQTETMVKILHEQGQTHFATKVCEKILTLQPENQKIRSLLEGIKLGNLPPKKMAIPIPTIHTTEESVPKFDDITEPGITFEALETKEEEELPSLANPMDEEKKRKLSLLENLLSRVQERKYEIH